MAEEQKTYTQPELEDVLKGLTDNQAKFLYKLLQAQNMATFAVGRAEGSVARDLLKLQIIEPYGRNFEGGSQRTRWHIKDGLFYPQTRKLLKELIGVIV